MATSSEQVAEGSDGAVVATTSKANELMGLDADADNENDQEEISLSEYIQEQIMASMSYDENENVLNVSSFLKQPDAYVSLKGDRSHMILPPIDWKVFRKAYTLLMWIRPVVLEQQPQVQPKESSTSSSEGRPPPKLLYRFATHPTAEESPAAVGLCCGIGQWHAVSSSSSSPSSSDKSRQNLLQTTVTVWNLRDQYTSQSQQLVQVPLLLSANEWSLVGCSHTFPYLTRPTWTLTVNGQVMGTAELNYPVVDVPMGSNVLLQSACRDGCATFAAASSQVEDDKKTASQLADTSNQVVYWPMRMDFCSVSLYPDVIPPQLQALVAAGGVQLSLQSQGKICTVLPPIDNWSKGSSLEGPNVGIPLCVSGGALDLQRLSSKVYLYFAATQARLLRNRIVLDMPYLPGETTQTPKVGLLQPGVAERPDDLPVLVVMRRGVDDSVPWGVDDDEDDSIAVHHTLSEFLLQCNSTRLDAQLSDVTKELSLAVLEQGWISSLVLPFFLAQLPPSHGLELQQGLYQQSLCYLWNLFTDEGRWAGSLVKQLADCIWYQGGRAQEMILQGGIIHVLSSTLRRALLRASLLRVQDYDTIDSFLASVQPTTEAAWHRPNHDESCPPWIPRRLIGASCQLIRSCCGMAVHVKDLTALVYIQRSSDLALTAVFGFGLHLDLWGNSPEACRELWSVLSHRYANLQGGHILRNQIPLQSFLDMIRTRIPEEFPWSGDLILLVQHMLLSSLSNRKLMHLAEADIAACMGALSDCPLGSCGARTILKSLLNLLQWCSSSPSSGAEGADEAKLGVVARMGRNLVISQYHDVLAPMLLSRTVFCGERSMSVASSSSDANKTNNNNNKANEGEQTKADKKDSSAKNGDTQDEAWQEDWRMALSLFVWVTSIAGPEGLTAAQSSGSLLLASGLAGSLQHCMAVPKEDRKFVASLFLPPPAMAMLVRGSGNSGGNQKAADSWTYTDLLSDRLSVMMPLLPGLVASALSDDATGTSLPIHVLVDMLSAVGGAFYRVMGVLTQTATAIAKRKPGGAAHNAIIKAAKDYVPSLILVVTLLENSIRIRKQNLKERKKDDDETDAVVVLVPPEAKTQGESALPSMDEGWVEASSALRDPKDKVAEVSDDISDEEAIIVGLETCLSNIMRTLTDLLSNSMRMGGGEASVMIWRSVFTTFGESLMLVDKKKDPTVARDLTCRMAAIVLNQAHQRDYEWETWKPELCSAVSRLCELLEQREILATTSDGVYSSDQTLLLSAISDVLSYGREVTGWCQLVLPTPPEPPNTEPMPVPRDEFHRQAAAEAANLAIAAKNNASISSIDSKGDDAYVTAEALASRFVPPEVPGASSKLLLPILQPCLQILLTAFGHVRSKVMITLPPTAADKGDEKQKQDYAPFSLVAHLAEELRESLTAAIVGLSFPNARDIALNALASLRRAQKTHKEAGDAEASAACSVLFVAVVEEIRVRYEGERRFRETALFDAYEDEGNGEEAAQEIKNANAVEQMILGGDLIPASPKLVEKVSTEEITFDDDPEEKAEAEQEEEDDGVKVEKEDAEATETSKEADPAKKGTGSGREDFVMFAGAYDNLKDADGKVTVGWNQLKGLGSALEECVLLVESTGETSTARTAEEKAEMTMSILNPFLDVWDETVEKDADESELVGMFDDFNIKDDNDSRGGTMQIFGSETAADVMSTYIEMASNEKARLTEVTALFLPSRRFSCQAYSDRYCWAKYFEIVDNNSAIGMNKEFERGMSDGNRDVRSRLVTMPCNPQFKRHLPRHLDHGQEVEPMATKDEIEESGEASTATLRRESSHVDDGAVDKMKSLMEAGNVEIVDITKKEITEAEVPEFSLEGQTENDEDDIYGDGSLGFPSRDGDDESNGEKTEATIGTDPTTVEDDNESATSTPSKASEKPLPITFHHHIASSIYSHPPDNSASILSLMQTSTARMIEKHFEDCLHVKAEGSRKCTVLLSATHLILEYDTESEGLFEGEMMAVKEEAERQRLIAEAGGASKVSDAKMDEIEKMLERRQKEIASMRPKSIRWNLSELSHVYLRRYRLRDTGLEMFFIPSGGTSYGGFGLFSPATSLFLDFGSGRDGNVRRDEAAHAVMRRAPPQTIKQWPDRSGQFLHEQLSRLTMGWVEGRITNFDYLLHLNMLAGRSYNDLCQYPVMPWVLSNYTSDEIPDLSDKSNFRDLTKPMGALNPDRLEDFLDRFNTFSDPTIPPFMYGSHYSTHAGVVLHFLVRMHPFAGLHRQLQGGHFDVADRLFSSVPRTWEMCTGFSAAEVKELTPEWYCNPAFLKNSNKFKLGTSQDKEVLGDVTLPPWAKGSPETFIEVMRNALESDVCSQMLPDWIDLIFGRKQQGPESVKANNVFFYLTYYGSVDVAAIEDEGLRQATELQIAHFGQCPMQLFVRPHVRRTIQIQHFQKLTFYQLLSAYTQGAGTTDGSASKRERQLTKDGSHRVFGEPLFLPFFDATESHYVHLEAPPPGPHADLIACRLAGLDRCLAVDGNGIFHSFRWAWKADHDDEEDLPPHKKKNVDRGHFIAQRELPRFRVVPRLIHTPMAGTHQIPAVAISKTLFASRSVLLVLSDGDGRGGLAMQLVDPAKASIRGEALVAGVHSAKITCIAMDPIGTAAGQGGVGGELGIVGSADGNASLWRFMSSHYLPLRPRTRMRGHAGNKIHAVALSSTIHICASVSRGRICLFSVGNGALIRTWGPPQDSLDLTGGGKTKTIFADTPACCLSVQGFVVTVCKTTISDDDGTVIRDVITLHLFSLEGVSLGSKALEQWRGIPRKIISTPDGTAVIVCHGRGVTIHRLSAITPLEFIDEWQITDTAELNESVPVAMDADFGPSLMRPIVGACAMSGGTLRFHALPGISAWSDRHRSGGGLFGKTVGSRIRNTLQGAFGTGKSAAKQAVNVGTDVAKEVATDVKQKGVGGFLAGTIFRAKKN